LYELPVGVFWDHRPGYTLVGDASSLMTPFAGEGVNKAMKDALELAEALQQNSTDDVDRAVRRYEEGMFPRAAKYQRKTASNKAAMFAANGTVAVMVNMVDLVADELGRDLTQGWISWVPLKTMVWCYATTWQVVGAWRRRLREMFPR
jgi:2-polyprenyl-6-methoxyphenol hydroxylase-like FAD-dependent oxidoreductase